MQAHLRLRLRLLSCYQTKRQTVFGIEDSHIGFPLSMAISAGTLSLVSASSEPLASGDCLVDWISERVDRAHAAPDQVVQQSMAMTSFREMLSSPAWRRVPES